MRQQKGLGRGLDALFSSEVSPHKSNQPNIQNISLGNIAANPSQPRQEIAQEELQELSRSIAELGLIQPITVRPASNGDYTIISGERRYRAAKMAGLDSIPAFVREANDEQMQTMALVENILREDLNALEIAIALKQLIEEYALTQDALSKKVSMQRSTISNYLRLLDLPDVVQVAIRGGNITMGHAKAIASTGNEEQALALLQLIEQNALSVRQAEAAAKRLNDDKKAPQSPQNNGDKSPIPSGFEPLSQHLSQIFPKGVTFKDNSRGGGRIVINYSNKNELKQLINELGING